VEMISYARCLCTTCQTTRCIASQGTTTVLRPFYIQNRNTDKAKDREQLNEGHWSGYLF